MSEWVEKRVKKALDAFQVREIDRQLELEKPIDGKQLKKMIEEYRNPYKPNNTWSFFWKLKQTKGQYWSIRYEPMWKLIYKQLFVHEMKCFYWSIALILFGIFIINHN
jgi:hypothetical protein